MDLDLADAIGALVERPDMPDLAGHDDPDIPLVPGPENHLLPVLEDLLRLRREIVEFDDCEIRIAAFGEVYPELNLVVRVAELSPAAGDYSLTDPELAHMTPSAAASAGSTTYRNTVSPSSAHPTRCERPEGSSGISATPGNRSS